MFATHDYSVMIGWCLEYMFIQSWLVDVWNIWIINHGWCCLCWGSTVCISGINYHGLFSSSIMEYRESEFGVYDIWLWRSCCIALHYITWHLELCHEPIVATVPVHHRLLGITMQLHTLLGMKAGVHMHPCAYIIGLA